MGESARSRSSRWRRPLVGIVNRFTYDDRYIIELNPADARPRTLVARLSDVVLAQGLGRRRLSSADDSGIQDREVPSAAEFPCVFHAANILLYAVASVLVLRARAAPAPAVGGVGRGGAVRRASGARRSGRERRRPVGAARRRRGARGRRALRARSASGAAARSRRRWRSRYSTPSAASRKSTASCCRRSSAPPS